MWYKINNESEVSTPAILVYPDRIEENVDRMILIAGDVNRLRPHVKTHKLAEIVQIQVKKGITRFKCANLSELKMVAENGGKDILVAYPLWGPALNGFFEMIKQYPEVKLSVCVGSEAACLKLKEEAQKHNVMANVFIDIDNGMHRTGVSTDEAIDLVNCIRSCKWLKFWGFHIYDGHIHEKDIRERTIHCENDFRKVLTLCEKMDALGVGIEELACGGTFSFPIHAKYINRTLCPGTPLLWDSGYKTNIPELDFLNAAVVVGRMIGKPENNYCFDLGYKSVASEMPHPRLEFLNLEQGEVLNHSEEHLVIASGEQQSKKEGDFVYALPWHICPTIAAHHQVYVVRNNKVSEKWSIVARDRIYH